MNYNKQAYEAKKANDPDCHRRRVYKLRYPDGDFDHYNSQTHCELCGVEFTKTGISRKVQDHDHSTGLVRGVVCNECNMRLRFTDKIGMSTLNKYYGLTI